VTGGDRASEMRRIRSESSREGADSAKENRAPLAAPYLLPVLQGPGGADHGLPLSRESVSCALYMGL
jgi:hypothetical protein